MNRNLDGFAFAWTNSRPLYGPDPVMCNFVVVALQLAGIAALRTG